MTSAELATDTVADRLRSEETRASILHALEATPAPTPHELALAAAPGLVDVAIDTQDRQMMREQRQEIGAARAEMEAKLEAKDAKLEEQRYGWGT